MMSVPVSIERQWWVGGWVGGDLPQVISVPVRTERQCHIRRTFNTLPLSRMPFACTLWKARR